MFEYSPALQELINSFIHEYQAQQPGSSLMLECLATQAAVVLLRESHNNLCHPTFQSEEYRNKKFFKEDYEELVFFRNSIRYHNHSIHIENKLLQQIKDSIPTYLLSYLIILTRGESSLEENK